MYTIKYFGDNIYTDNITEISDVKYVNVFNLDYNFATEKSIIADSVDNDVSVCFYKNKGINIFPFGEYKEKNIKFSNKTFYQDLDFNHDLDSVSGYKSSYMFLGSFEASSVVAGNCGIKISFSDVYNVVFSFWIYINNNILYVKNNNSVLYSTVFEESNLSFGIYNNVLIVNSKNIITIDGNFLPYNFFIYGNINELYITSKFFMPLVFEGTGDVIDDIYGDVYCITKSVSGLGYLKSKANNVLTLCDDFAFDIAFRAVGHSVPFSISNGATFSGSNFVMDNASVWVDFDAINDVFYSNILTTSGILTISGTALKLNDYYLMRCYYKDNKFGTILNGIDTWSTCDNVAIFGGSLNILTRDTLIIDSFALYNKSFPTQDSYDKNLGKLMTAVSGTALVNSHEVNKFLFGVDNFFPKNSYYVGTYSGIGEIPIFSSDFVYYTQYSLAGGEVELSNDYFYAGRIPFKEDVYNCFACENDKTFLTYFSGIVVPVNKVLAESFTNYRYVNDNFITTNSGLYICNYSKIFNPINSVSIIEFSDIGWTDSFNFGVLFGVDSIPTVPDVNCSVVTSSGQLYIGTTVTSELNVNYNNSIYFYLDDSSITISGSDTGILGSGIVTDSYEYVRYFVRSTDINFATIGRIYISTAEREIDTLTNKFFSYALPEYYDLDSSYEELFYNIGNNITNKGITIYDTNFYKCDCSFSTYYDATFSGMFNLYGYDFLGIDDNFKNGFMTERWRLVCSPYGVYSCNQPGWLYDFGLVDAVDIYATSTLVEPETGFVILCDIDYYDGDWINIIDDYVSPTLSGESWPIRHIIPIPPVRTSQIRVVPNGTWNEEISITEHASCFYNYGGTASCTVSGNTCVHVALDDILYVYAEYNLEGSFDLVFSGINYYPLNSKLELKNYFGNECYIETNWISSSGCNITMSSGLGDISTTVSGFSDSFIYNFYISRNLNVISLIANVQDGDGGNIATSYQFSSDDVGLDLVFYNEDIPHAIGSGCLFDFKSDNYTVKFSSISAGYSFEALDGTDNISTAGVSFDSYPPNLFVNKIKGSYIEQSNESCNELTSSGFQLVSNIIGDNIDIKTNTKIVGGVQQVSKFNRLVLFSDYAFVPAISYRSYVIGKDKQYISFSDISFFIQTGDKVYFYPGNYSVSTDKQITIIGVGNSINICLKIQANNGLTVMGCTTTEIQGSGVFNMYNCYILSWKYWITDIAYIIVLYNLIYINFYNCNLYNYANMSVDNSYALLHKCAVCSSTFSRATIHNEGYSTRGYYGYGPEFNRASIISGLSHIDNITVSNFYYNSVYSHFPLNNQLAIEKDNCSQLLSSNDSYSVYFYGDIKKLNSFFMYLFVQDLDGKIEIKNSSDFVFTVDSNNLNAGMHLVMNIYNSKVDIAVPISHSNVFRLAIIAVVFDGGSISIYLNGAKLATKYIIVMAFNDPNSYLDDSVLFFDKTKFVCDGNGLLLKGANLKERIDFLIGTHVEEQYSNCFTEITINMEFTTYPVLANYHNNGATNYYGYVAHNSGVGLYYDKSDRDYKYVCFNANKSYKISNNVAKIYRGTYRYFEWTMNGEVCTSDSSTEYVLPVEKNSVILRSAKIDGLELGWCDIIDPYGYISLDLVLPMPVIKRSTYCFDTETSVVALSFDLSDDPYVHDVSPNQFVCHLYEVSYTYSCGTCFVRNGIFHNSIEWQGGDYCYINNNILLNLNNNFTIECLFSFCKDGYLVTKGVLPYNVAYRVGVNSRYIPYFRWSWEGDNTVYANKPIMLNAATYIVVIVGIDTITFYINGKEAGTKYTDKLIIVNNSEELRVVSNYPSSACYKNIVIEELCLSNRIKTKEEIKNTWNKISGGDKEPWIRLSSVVVVSDKPIKTSPSDRFIEADNKIDTSKWEYTAYMKPITDSSGGLILDSRKVKKIKSKVVSYSVIFDVSIFCEVLNYSVDRDWSVEFRYKFSSGNYISAVVSYVKNDDICVKCRYYYNDYEESTIKTKIILSPCGIRFVTDNDGYTSVQVGSSNYWYTLLVSSQNLFVETCGWLEVILSNDDWDSWFIIKLTDFLPRLYCSSIVDGQSSGFYDAIPYGRSFYNQTLKNVTMLTLSNDVFEVDSTLANTECIHSLEFINGQMPDLHVLNLNNRIFNNVNYETFNIELLVYLTYDNTCVLDLFPWININVENKYLYIIMHDNDRTITDTISEILNNYIYISVSLSKPYTIIHINNQKFTYDTNFTDVLPYHFYPIGKEFSGRVVYFCGYYGNFDETGYKFRLNTLSRYIGFDNCGRKIFGNNMVTSLDLYSIIYAYNNPSYSALLVSMTCNIIDWITGWNKRIKLTILGLYIEEDLSDFPILVHLDSTCLGVFNELGSNSKRISIVTSDEQQCYVEIENWDESINSAWLWVKVPTLFSGIDSDLYLYYDNSHFDNSAYVGIVDEIPAQNVWDSNFVGVWHMNQDPSGGSGCIKDSTLNISHATPNGSMTPEDLVDGKISKALNFDGDDDYLVIPYAILLDLDEYNSITIEGMINIIPNNCYFIWTNQASNSDFIFLYVNSDGSVWFRIYQYDNTYDQRAWYIDSNINAGWHYIAVTHINNIDPVIYIDGVSMLFSLYSSSGDNVKHTTDNKSILIASNYSEDVFTTGEQEELRVSDKKRSASWIKATYYSNWNQLLNYGDEEVPPSGSSGEGSSLDVKILFDPAILQSLISHIIVIKCNYLDLKGKKTTSITLSAVEHTVSHNYYDSFGDIGNSDFVFSYDLIGTCYDNDSVFYLNIDTDILEKVLNGKIVLNVKNNEMINITNICIYLNGELSINEVYGSSLFV